MSTPNEFTFEISKATNYLKQFTQDQPDRILKDKKSYSSLILIGKTLYDHSENVDFEVFIKNSFDQVILNYWKEIFKIRMNIDFKTKIDWRNAETAIEKNEILVQTFNFLFFITTQILIRSVGLCFLFVQNDGLRLCLELLNDKAFIIKNKDVKVGIQSNPLDITEYISALIIQHLVVNTCDELKHVWTSLNAAEVLFEIAKVNSTNRLNSYFSLAYLLDDKQIEKLAEENEMKLILNSFIKLIIKASESFKKNDFRRIIKEVNFKGKPIKCDIHYIEREDGIWNSVTGILNCLYQLAVNDKIKFVIYSEENFKNYFKIFLEKGNFFEIF